MFPGFPMSIKYPLYLYMLKLGTILPAALLAMLPVLPLAAQEQYGGINGNGTAAFDPGWIFIYYANTGNRNSLAA